MALTVDGDTVTVTGYEPVTVFMRDADLVFYVVDGTLFYGEAVEPYDEEAAEVVGRVHVDADGALTVIAEPPAPSSSSDVSP